MIGLAFAAFVFNTSEFLPVGLLPDMAASLNESVSFMGLVITGYAWVVSIMSLPLALLTARFERKKLLLFLLALQSATSPFCGSTASGRFTLPASASRLRIRSSGPS